ncbi:hypothetical protein NL676_021031 [Syzygium grande]|nr:hypothetical protein NL676_021031 [Syzygium grande]
MKYVGLRDRHVIGAQGKGSRRCPTMRPFSGTPPAAGLEGNRAKCSVSGESRSNTTQSQLVRRQSSKDRTSSLAGHGGAEAPSDWISNSDTTRKAARDGAKQQTALPVQIATALSGRGIGRKKKRTTLFSPFWRCLLW